MIVLGVETSCDETSIALLDNGRVLGASTYTQMMHARFGGVVPEIASRAHLQKVDRLCEAVLDEAKLKPGDLDLIAVTDTPGLAGALLVGISFALGMHAGYGIPITGVNHLEGHICSVLLEHDDITFPLLALVVSGGHTAIYRVDDPVTFRCLGQTVDDAAGEAFDKIGKLLGFPYPAGQRIEQESQHGSGDRSLQISFPVARFNAGAQSPGTAYNFSFSGLKTAAKNYIEAKGEAYIRENVGSFCDAFQGAIVQSLRSRLMEASENTGIAEVAVVGGVACNGALRKSLQSIKGLNVRFPSPKYCTDNGAMIARAGYEHVKRGITSFPVMMPTSRNR